MYAFLCVFLFLRKHIKNMTIVVLWVNKGQEQFASIMKSNKERSEPEVFLRERRRSTMLR